MASRYSFKHLVLMPPRLRHEDLRVLLLSPAFIRSLFKNFQMPARTPVRKGLFTSKILAKLSREPIEFTGAANGQLRLAG
jgi:hypothetical protein